MSNKTDQKVVTKTIFGESKLSYKKNLNPSEKRPIKGQSVEKIRKLPEVQEDKQESENNQSQGIGNVGDRASN